MDKFNKISFASPISEDLRWRAILMKEMLGYQVDEVAAALRMPLSFDPTTLIEIAVLIYLAKPKRRVPEFSF